MRLKGTATVRTVRGPKLISIAVALVALTSCGGSSSSSSSSSGSTVGSNASATGGSTSSLTLPSAPANACTLTAGEVSAVIGYTVQVANSSPPEHCDYRDPDEQHTHTVNISVDEFNVDNEVSSKSQDVFSLGGDAQGVTTTDVSGFPRWAFMASTSRKDIADLTVYLGNGHLSIRIYLDNPIADPQGELTSLAHKILG